MSEVGNILRIQVQAQEGAHLQVVRREVGIFLTQTAEELLVYQVEVVLERIPEQVVVATLHLQQQFAGILGGDGSLAHAFEQSLLRLTDGVVHRHHIESHACHVLSLKGELVL